MFRREGLLLLLGRVENNDGVVPMPTTAAERVAGVASRRPATELTTPAGHALRLYLPAEGDASEPVAFSVVLGADACRLQLDVELQGWQDSVLLLDYSGRFHADGQELGAVHDRIGMGTDGAASDQPVLDDDFFSMMDELLVETMMRILMEAQPENLQRMAGILSSLQLPET